MFKNVMVYRIVAAWSASVEQMEEGLSKGRFVSCGATQEKSVGWIEPRGEAHGPLVEHRPRIYAAKGAIGRDDGGNPDFDPISDDAPHSTTPGCLKCDGHRNPRPGPVLASV